MDMTHQFARSSLPWQEFINGNIPTENYFTIPLFISAILITLSLCNIWLSKKNKKAALGVFILGLCVASFPFFRTCLPGTQEKLMSPGSFLYGRDRVMGEPDANFVPLNDDAKNGWTSDAHYLKIVGTSAIHTRLGPKYVTFVTIDPDKNEDEFNDYLSRVGYVSNDKIAEFRQTFIKAFKRHEKAVWSVDSLALSRKILARARVRAAEDAIHNREMVRENATQAAFMNLSPGNHPKTNAGAK